MASFSLPVVSVTPGFMASPLHVFPKSLIQVMARWRQESLPMVITNHGRSGQAPGMHLMIHADYVWLSVHRRTGKSIYRYVDVAGILSLDGVPADYHDAVTLKAMIRRLLQQVQVEQARVLGISNGPFHDADPSWVALSGYHFHYLPADATAVMASEWLALLEQDGHSDTPGMTLGLQQRQ